MRINRPAPQETPKESVEYTSQKYLEKNKTRICETKILDYEIIDSK